MHRIAVSICELLKADGLNLHGRGPDAANGAPMLDWTRETMSNYW